MVQFLQIIGDAEAVLTHHLASESIISFCDFGQLL